MSKRFLGRNMELSLTLRSDATGEKIRNSKINNDNSLTVQHYEFSPSTKTVKMSADGEGIAFVGVAYSYLQDTNALSTPGFALAATPTYSNDRNIAIIKICTNFIPDDEIENSRMVMVEVNLPSGYEFKESNEIFKSLKGQLGKLNVNNIKVCFQIVISEC